MSLSFSSPQAGARFRRMNHIGQQLVQTGLGEQFAAAFVSLAGRPAFVDPRPCVEFLNRRNQGLMFEVQLEDGSNAGRLVFIDNEL